MTFVQPPKKKGGKKKGKKGAKAKTPMVIDGVSVEEMTKEQVLLGHLLQFKYFFHSVRQLKVIYIIINIHLYTRARVCSYKNS